MPPYNLRIVTFAYKQSPLNMKQYIFQHYHLGESNLAE